MDLDPEGLRGVANDLAALRSGAARLAGFGRRCTVVAAHFGAPDADGRLGARFTSTREDLIADLVRAECSISALADELRASADVTAAADQHGARQLRSAGEELG
jgi:hypothetical protein